MNGVTRTLDDLNDSTQAIRLRRIDLECRPWNQSTIDDRKEDGVKQGNVRPVEWTVDEHREVVVWGRHLSHGFAWAFSPSLSRMLLSIKPSFAAPRQRFFVANSTLITAARPWARVNDVGS